MKDIFFKSRFGEVRKISYADALAFVKWKMQAMVTMDEQTRIDYINESLTGVKFKLSDLK